MVLAQAGLSNLGDYPALFAVIILGFIPLYLLYTMCAELRSNMDRRCKLNIFAQPGSKFASHVVENCSTLQTGYRPASMWGSSGQIQTLVFGIGVVGHNSIPEVKGQRYTVLAVDGSTLYYDVYDPPKKKEMEEDLGSGDQERCPYSFFVCPGINNSSESSYVRGFTAYVTKAGYRVIVYNHLGALKAEKLTGHRIFTYAGTGDMALVFEDICCRFPHTKLMGCGYSLGAFVLIRFLGEKKERRDKFICAISCCQGYEPLLHIHCARRWKKLGRFYSYALAKSHLKILSRHRNELFPQIRDDTHEEEEENVLLPYASSSSPHPPDSRDPHFAGFPTEIIHGQHNSNGFCLDRDLKKRHSLAIDEERVWASTNMIDLDDCYTRHALGFETVEEMYKWMACTELMNEIDDFPLLFLNALDDPCVVLESHDIPKTYVESHPKSIFVQTQHGGHIGFYEGGLSPNWTTWMDRLILEYFEACISALQDANLN